MKPKVLYHASTNININILVPSALGRRYPAETPYVFATPDKRIAAMFLAPKDAGSTEICKFDDETMIAIQTTAEHYLKVDKGGAIYDVSSDLFSTDANIGMGEAEYFSPDRIKPIGRQIFDTSIAAMNTTGVRLYFVDADMMQRIRSASDHGRAIFALLDPYC